MIIPYLNFAIIHINVVFLLNLDFIHINFNLDYLSFFISIKSIFHYIHFTKIILLFSYLFFHFSIQFIIFHHYDFKPNSLILVQKHSFLLFIIINFKQFIVLNNLFFHFIQPNITSNFHYF